MVDILQQCLFQAKKKTKIFFLFFYCGTKKKHFSHFKDLFFVTKNCFRDVFLLISVVHLSNSMLSAVGERLAKYSRTFKKKPFWQPYADPLVHCGLTLPLLPKLLMYS